MKPCDMIGQILHYSVSLRQINSSLRCALLEVAESSLIIIYEEQALHSHKENEARVCLKIQRSWVRYKKNALNRRVCTVHWLVLTSLLAEKSDVCNVSQRTPAACGENIAMTWILANTKNDRRNSGGTLRQKISQRYPKEIPKISKRYPKDIPMISQRYPKDIPKISQ